MSVRVFASAEQPGELTLSAEESHYLVRVRRARAGTPVEVLDPLGGGWDAQVDLADAKQTRLLLHGPLPERAPWAIDVVVGVPDAKAAYDVVARAVESGARSLAFVETARTQPVRLNARRVERVVAAARRQCGRLDVPTVRAPTPLEAWLAKEPRGFVASVVPAADFPPPSSTPVAVLIGPEGGLSPQEQQRAEAAGLVPLSLGPFVLRTEVAVTAAIAVVGQISGG